ncbi:hypothetical protein [Pelagicoccus sp. SDUM812002]|uniref:hypothetical protein n=1 Tax=Pelagicoccus sp. SDUM812002 TaxID=3041266 RepID=UPI00280CE7A5|nr:hypothetical protein [Pelagicoccus sp. SDUM812002]MDQ8185776.1 hypothetical protein [Pelagicoccus sp. SDUM812002]
MTGRIPIKQRTYYVLSLGTLIASVAIASNLYPTFYDWQYTVVSALASSKHNPQGYAYLSAGISISMAFLFPYAAGLTVLKPGEKRSVRALKTGIIFGILTGVESLATPGWPASLDKVHEALALFCFLFTYGGILGYAISRAKSNRSLIWPAAVIVAPIAAIGICQLSLYLGQRDLGWVDQSWRDMGIPLWQSFAFWQWIALWSLWAAAGMIGFLSPRTD